jgi:hypothetical protein
MFKPLTAVLLGANVALGFTYQDQDVLLVFRKDGFNDVEFNLGPITQFRSVAPGASLAVTNWDPGVVTNQFLFSEGAQVTIVAATPTTASPKKVWLSNAELSSAPTDLTPSQWQGVWSKINSVGSRAALASGNTPANSWVVAPTTQNSFSWIASNNGSLPGAIKRLGGATAFNVVSALPVTLRFFEVKATTASPKPASVQLGTFQVGTDGSVIYTAAAGTVAPGPVTISGIQLLQGVPTITFPTVTGVNYRLRISDVLSGSPTKWSIGPSVVSGNGQPAVLSDVGGVGLGRFYSVESFE